MKLSRFSLPLFCIVFSASAFGNAPLPPGVLKDPFAAIQGDWVSNSLKSNARIRIQGRRIILIEPHEKGYVTANLRKGDLYAELTSWKRESSGSGIRFSGTCWSRGHNNGALTAPTAYKNCTSWGLAYKGPVNGKYYLTWGNFIRPADKASKLGIGP